MPNVTDVLATFYASRKIGVDEFECPSQGECDSAAEMVGKSLRHGSEAHIGSRYGDPFRIVIVSLSDIESAARLSDHEKYERGLCFEWDLNPHLVGTQEILEAVLTPAVVGREVFRHFSLTRAAKCALKIGSSKPPDLCFQNCKQFVVPELDVLNPDLVITQGREAWWALDDRSHVVPDEHLINSIWPVVTADHSSRSLFEGYIREYIRILQLSSRTATLLKLSHPAARQGQWALMKRLGAVGLLGAVARQLVRSDRRVI